MSSSPSISKRPLDEDAGRTRWSMVAAVSDGSEADAKRSLAELCRRYWVPIYLYARRCGRSAEDADRLVRTFLSRLFAQLRGSAPRLDVGFRAHLQRELEAFLRTDPAPAETGETLPGTEAPWPRDEIERRYGGTDIADASPEDAFQRSFALELLAIALARLEHEAERGGRGELFAAVQPFLSRAPQAADYAALAERFETSPLAMVIAVKRLRQRFQEIVDEELADTIGSADALSTERHTLLSLVRPVADRE